MCGVSNVPPFGRIEIHKQMASRLDYEGNLSKGTIRRLQFNLILSELNGRFQPESEKSIRFCYV